MKARNIQARSLLADDHFKMGGQVYRIRKAELNDLGGIVVTAYPIGSHFSQHQIILILEPCTPVRIYNQ